MRRGEKMSPMIGAIVHYMSIEDSKIKPAMVMAIHKGDKYDPVERVSLLVFSMEGVEAIKNIPYSKSYNPGHWNYPPSGNA
jgi:hypothetical protein